MLLLSSHPEIPFCLIAEYNAYIKNSGLLYTISHHRKYPLLLSSSSILSSYSVLGLSPKHMLVIT